MRLTIIGSSSGTGAQLAAAARDAGHEVIGLSRRGQAPAGVLAIAGDATDPAVLRNALDGTNAVVVTVGGSKGVPQARTEVTRAVIAAMQATGVRRLIVQSSLGAGDSRTQLPAFLRPVILAALAKPLQDHNEQEAAVVASGLDWTIVRPGSLSDKPATGSWRSLRTSKPGKLGRAISRADLAAFLLEALGDEDSVGAAIGVSG